MEISISFSGELSDAHEIDFYDVSQALIGFQRSLELPVGPVLTRETYEYVLFTSRGDMPLDAEGRVSSYNMNTFKGRFFLNEEQRPIPFELASNTRDARSVRIITDSLAANAQNYGAGMIKCQAFREFSRTGRLKRLLIVEVLG